MVKKILLGTIIVLALVLWAIMVWFAFPLVGFGETRPFDPVWVRVALIAAVWVTVGIVYLVKFIRRRRAAKALEEAMTEPQVSDDGEVLSEKMGEALSVLKQSSGSKSYLYELPWYVIIGPPGAGKTTALLNSGIKFPLAEKGEGAVAGVGGTRYCDWWFSEEAVLIDTAGRYTTQDSDAEADKESWFSFLKLLKTHRANQPINGVILAISLQEIMTGTPAELDAHAETIRQRLIELNEQLKVDFPVYVLFTKADLISGFMEYFGSFSQSRRQKVWGHTFQTSSKKEPTVEQFGSEYDALVGRLSEEVTDRLQEEPDGVNRIAIFGFPGQVAMLRDRLSSFMTGIFGHTRYKVNANLRGFYFTSGTQEGTPIDQVLGAMDRSFGGAAAAAGMGGRGKSFFLHDLLRRVIFSEAGWVSTDRRAVMRARVLRYGAYGAITAASVALLGLWGWSFWQNRELVRTAEAALADYELAAQEELQSAEVSDPDLLNVVAYLDMLRSMPTGYVDAEEDAALTERFGLSQRERLESASRTTYRQALERMFRSRLILRLEQQLQQFIREGEVLATYETLKVYKLLGDAAPKSDDQVILAWFREDWRSDLYPGPQNADNRASLEAHLVAMLELDAAQEPSFELNGALIDQAERMLARMNVADQAYSLIQASVQFTPIEPFSVENRSGRDAELVFETVNGEALDEQVIPALYTYAGFHDFFLPQLGEIADRILDERWVMGEYAEAADIEDQIGQIGPILIDRYTDDWIREWEAVLGNIKLRPMAADSPAYQALAAASAARTSPILLLTQEVGAETRLTSEFEGDDGGGPAIDAGAAGEAAGEVGALVAQETIRRQNYYARIGLEAVFDKSQARVGPGSSAGSARRLPGAEIEAYFADWHDLTEGAPGQRRIDLLLATLNDMQRSLILAVDFPNQAAAQMPAQIGALKQAASRLPDALARMTSEAIDDFEGDAANTDIARLNEALNSSVTQACEAIVGNRYPFARDSARDVPMAEFARLFAPNGVMDRFFLQELSPYADLGEGEWRWKDEGPLAGKLSAATLKQFERAAAIRDAYFPTGGGVPSVDMTINPVSMHNRIESAVLQINGQIVTTRPRGNTPANINWPGSMGGGNVSLQFTPEMRGRESQMSLNGAWAFLRFINDGSPNVSGTEMQVRYVVGGRNIAYRIDVAASENPFFLRELSEFSCPNGL
ncbi:type VI secretion system membrane subunit TssM [Tropicimonas sp. IMCC34011]|uniref:type VI secretion system membrane subunit TssM n=1 Tax=Tropicimonas sp. IMCC34011 TaxID=2248759 RepID=UPI000E27A9EB|nr:type VI secretion system membrane subunit TssM [Tropicimonas sp. IMCC34011]